MKSASMTVRMTGSTKARIIRLAEATHRTKAFILDKAIQEYLDTHEWQVSETVKATKLADSDQAKWINHADLKAKWAQRGEN
jgi:RHH-type transcriptional regulator, rel operon repressor / antitoxin RelB